MKLDPKQYDEMVNRASPPSPVVRDCVWAFCVGGAICTLGEGLRQLFLIWYDKTLAGTLTSIALIFLAAVFTLPGWYQKLAAKAGRVTGAHHRVCQPGRQPGDRVQGRGLGDRRRCKDFGIAGPVIAFGTLASFVWGVIYWLLGKVG